MVPHNKQYLLLKHLDLLTGLETRLPVLDLACGCGNNGVVLSRLGIPVVFADRSEPDLAKIERQLEDEALPGRTWLVDLEQPGTSPLAGLEFSAILAFRYLHRPLFPALRESIMPGGLVFYETFTTENRRFGRPSNPDFLLKTGELKAIFEDWRTIFYFEGDLQQPDRNVARLVARKPGLPDR